MVDFHELEISEVMETGENAVSLAFHVSADLREMFKFIPGQYLTLRATLDGAEVRRSYSICSGADENLRVGIKQVEGGQFSTYAQTLQAGDVVEVMPPDGRFTCNTNNQSGRNILLIASGSGITPILSITAHVLEAEPASTVTLLYGNQTTNSIMFRRELEILKDMFLTRFHLHHVLSRETQDVELFSGRIDVERVEAMSKLGLINPETSNEVYICGPQQMSESLREHFLKTGIDETKVHVELFGTDEDREPKVISNDVSKVIEQGAEIEIVLDGVRRSVVMHDEKDTVLSAAQKSGLELPFSCAGGMCATCRCKVLEGDAEMDKHYSLAQWELDAGFVLSCQLRPKSEKLVLDFDAT